MEAILKAAEGMRLEAYLGLSLMTGIRTEKVRALTWEQERTGTRQPTRPCRRTWPCGAPSGRTTRAAWIGIASGWCCGHGVWAAQAVGAGA